MKRIFSKSTYSQCVILLILSFIFACKDPAIVGLQVQPAGDQLNVEHCDTITLFAYSVREDSIRTDETTSNLLGSSVDPVFGKCSASFYAQLRLSENNADFGENPVLDSITLSLPYKGIYGDSNALQTVKVYEMAEDIYKDSVYYSNSEFLTTGVPIASMTFVPNIKDSVIVGADTLPPQLRIHLNPSVGQKFIDASGSTSLSDNTNFLKFFKGIYVTTTYASGEGAIISLNLLNAQSKVTMYYKNDTDTLTYNFVISEGSARIGHFNHARYQYADTYLRSEIYGDTLKGDSILFLQSMAGLKIRILYPYIKELVKNGRIAINKADLIVTVDDNDMSLSDYQPPPKLILLEEKDGLIRYLLDQLEGATYFGGTYSSSKKEYKFNIARHIQQVVDGIKENLGLYLVDFTVNRPNEAARVVLKGPKRSIGNLRLQITYTKLY